MKVLVLVGGDSNEREVSLDSGAAICQALERLGHQVRAIDPVSGQMLLENNGGLSLPAATSGEVAVMCEGKGLSKLTQALDTDDIDVVFIALHGGGGENGSIQNLLDVAGKKYSGSGMAASVVAMDKAMAKRVMATEGVATPRWRLFRLDEAPDTNQLVKEIEAEFRLPLIVKPNDGGSTIGLTKVDDFAELPEAIRLSAEHSRELLVEEFIAGRELTVSVLDRRPLPVVEVKPVSGLYDYQAKYTQGKSEYVAPAEIDDELARRMQTSAVKVYTAIGCSGLARVDFILDDNQKPFCLELNTLPGMTALSLSPMAAKCEGIDFDRLVAMIIESALR